MTELGFKAGPFSLNSGHPAGYHFGVGAFVEHGLVLGETPAVVDLFGERGLSGLGLAVGLGGAGEDLRCLFEVVVVEETASPGVGTAARWDPANTSWGH